MSNESLRVGLAIAVCIGAFITVAGIAGAITYVFFDSDGYLRRRRKEAALDAVAVSRRREPWGTT